MLTPADRAAADKILTTTRAVRKRLDFTRPVPKELILECIAIAQQAPTGGNRQGWHFVVVTDPEKRKRIGELYLSSAGANLRAARDAAPDAQTRRVYDSAVYLGDHIGEAPVHVFPCRVGPLPEITTPAQAAGAFSSIIPAAWSFMLAARARGLGTAWTSVLLADRPALVDLLGLPDDVHPAVHIPTAFYTGDDFKPAARPGPETITSWDVYSPPS